MKEKTAYTVVLQVEQFAGLGKHTVNILASDKDNARTAAIEKAEKDGYKVTNCHSVELAG
ncbi:hypothetical protein D3C75_751830 [compost metagenome]